MQKKKQKKEKNAQTLLLLAPHAPHRHLGSAQLALVCLPVSLSLSLSFVLTLSQNGWQQVAFAQSSGCDKKHFPYFLSWEEGNDNDGQTLRRLCFTTQEVGRGRRKQHWSKQCCSTQYLKNWMVTLSVFQFIWQICLCWTFCTKALIRERLKLPQKSSGHYPQLEDDVNRIKLFP